MNEWIELFVIATVAVCVFTAIYKIMPFKVWKQVKPKIVFFPKYIAKYEIELEDIESRLLNLGFIKSENYKFTRGKIYGDFSAKAIKLTILIDDAKKEIRIFASFFGILFDTGDIWQLTSDIQNNEKH